MKKFIVDANLPYYFSLWNTEEYIHVFDINDEMSDEEIWNYAQGNNLTIITKDADFSNRVFFVKPPPKVIHIRVGNIKMKEFYNFLIKNWNKILELLEKNKLVNVFIDRIEGIN